MATLAVVGFEDTTTDGALWFATFLGVFVVWGALGIATSFVGTFMLLIWGAEVVFLFATVGSSLDLLSNAWSETFFESTTLGMAMFSLPFALLLCSILLSDLTISLASLALVVASMLLVILLSMCCAISP